MADYVVDPALLTACADFTRQWEGDEPFMYLDSADPANVTAGIGCLLATIEDAATLFQVNADDPQLIADWDAIRAQRPCMAAPYYSAYTKLRLAPGRSLFMMKAQMAVNYIPACARIVAGFDALPQPVKIALVDIQYNVRRRHFQGGVTEFPHMLAAIAAGDWAEAAIQSNRPQLVNRSAAVKALIESAIPSDVPPGLSL